MNILQSYAAGQWIAADDGKVLRSAINGDPVARINSEGIDFQAMLTYGKTVGGPALRQLSFHQRALMLKALAQGVDTRWYLASMDGKTTTLKPRRTLKARPPSRQAPNPTVTSRRLHRRRSRARPMQTLLKTSGSRAAVALRTSAIGCGRKG